MKTKKIIRRKKTIYSKKLVILPKWYLLQLHCEFVSYITIMKKFYNPNFVKNFIRLNFNYSNFFGVKINDDWSVIFKRVGNKKKLNKVTISIII